MADGVQEAGKESPPEPEKAQALAALTIACMSAIDEGTPRREFFAALERAFRSPNRAGDEAAPTGLAATVAHEAGVSLESLQETAALVWEAIENERASEASDPY
jgi:hypothetical protein